MENIYETLQNIYIRPYLESAISKTIDTTATVKNEVIISNETQYSRESLSPPEPDSPRETPEKPDSPRETPEKPDSPRETPEKPDSPRESLSPPEELKAHTICDLCGGKYSYFNKKRHYTTKKHLSATPSSLPLSSLPPSSLPLPL